MAGQAVMDLEHGLDSRIRFLLKKQIIFYVVFFWLWCHLSIFIQTFRLKYHYSQIASA